MLAGLEQVGKAVECLDDAAAMKGGDDEVAGGGCLEGGDGGFLIADFSEENDVWTLAEGRSQAGGEIAGVLADLAL